MRFACILDFCSVDDRLRSSSSAWGLSGPSCGSLAVPVRPATSLTACSGSISSLTSLKRTVCAGGEDVMVEDGVLRGVFCQERSAILGHDERPGV
jgi:hypothetical protein